MKKILFISYNFAPRQTVGSIRPSKFAANLCKMGHTVDVVSVKPFGKLDPSTEKWIKNIHHFYHIDRQINPEKTYQVSQSFDLNVTKSTEEKESITKVSLLLSVKKMLGEAYKLFRSFLFVKDLKKCVRNNKEAFSQYDIMISSYTPIVSHLCALQIKKMFPDIFWIADFRDPIVTYNTSKAWIPFYSAFQKKVCRKADRTTHVSYGYFDRVVPPDRRDKGRVIYNGYDSADIKEIVMQKDSLFSITYTGSLYEGKRDATPLFRALSELIAEGKIKKDDLVLNYAGSQADFYAYQVNRFGLGDCFKNYGVLSRDNCMKLMGSSRTLLLLTWNDVNDSGMIPLKLYEYIMLRRPILCLITGNAVGHESKKMIADGHFGFTYEEANRDVDYPKLKEYLLADYQAFLMGQDALIQPIESEVNKYDFAELTRQLSELFEGSANKSPEESVQTHES